MLDFGEYVSFIHWTEKSPANHRNGAQLSKHF